MPTLTPLLAFLRSLTPEQREAFAAHVGTTTGYLYQIAAQQKPNPRLRLALAIVSETKRIAPRLKTPVLSLEDLPIGPTPDASEYPD